MIDDPLTADERVQQFWDACAASARVGVENLAVVRFGDSSDLADELATQVVVGEKRATTTDDGTEVILERFEVVWPLGRSDRP